jgi:glutamate-1-semialdehyde 2,1-aminomutase
MEHAQSKVLFERAQKIIPGGVNSPVRAFAAVGMTPLFIKEAKGCYIKDVDDNSYIDYVCSWGPLILGHSSPIALDKVGQALEKGSSYGMPTEIEIQMAERIQEAMPSMEMMRMVSSGTEATMSAIRLARGYTSRAKIIKFEGCYHGHSDGLLVKSGSGSLTGGVPTSLGVPDSIIEDTLIAKFNDIDSVKKLIKEFKGNIAGIIVEPVPGNMGLVEQKDDFLKKLRKVSEEEGIILIFDEVISGFRIAFGGASAHYGIEPDLICLGKIIGGGLPVGAYGGKKELMELIAPLGGVYQAGTLSGNPVAMQMGLNVLDYLKDHQEIYRQMETMAIRLKEGFEANLKRLAITDVTINRVAGMLCQFFAKGPVNSFEEVMLSDTQKYATYFKAMEAQGILLPPAQYECMFLSAAHTQEVIEETIDCHYKAMEKVYNS